MIHIIGWFLTTIAIIAVILNIKKKRACFYIWTVTNAGWCIIDLAHGLHHQALLFFVYFLFAIWGIFAWRGRRLTAERVDSSE